MPEQLLPRSQLSPQLRLVRFIWRREHERDAISFTAGFNLLGERTQTERTMILRLIRYAMGGSHSRIDDEIMRATREVRLEFLANERPVTTSRRFDHPTGKFTVNVEGRPPLSLTPNEMGEFLLELLEIPKVHYQSGQRRSLLSFNDLARAFVVDRDFSYAEILAKVYPEPRREIIKLMLGLTTQEIANAEEEIREVESQVRQLADEIRGVERLLLDFQVGSLIEIENKRGGLLELLDKIQDEEDTLRRKIEQAASRRIPEEAYRSDEFQILREELIVKRERLGEIESELAALDKQIREKTDLKALLESEARKLERHTLSQYVLSTFTFSRCPRCLRLIDDDMRAQEHESRCMLCGRPLQLEMESDREVWDKALADANKAVQEADQLLAYYSTREESLKRERSEVQNRVEWLQAALARQTAKYVSPFIEDLSLINERRSQLLKTLSEVELEEKQRRYADRLRDDVLPGLRRDLDKLEGKLLELQMRRGRPAERIEAFLTHFNSFMRETASNQFKRSSWDEAEFLPKINDEEYFRAMTGPDLAISVLAFHYALLAMKVKLPRFDTAHPGLLIVDEPQQQRMEPGQYRRIMQLLIELATEHHEKLQVIVAATDVRELEDYLQPILTNRE